MKLSVLNGLESDCFWKQKSHQLQQACKLYRLWSCSKTTCKKDLHNKRVFKDIAGKTMASPFGCGDTSVSCHTKFERPQVYSPSKDLLTNHYHWGFIVCTDDQPVCVYKQNTQKQWKNQCFPNVSFSLFEKTLSAETLPPVLGVPLYTSLHCIINSNILAQISSENLIASFLSDSPVFVRAYCTFVHALSFEI